SPRPAPAHAMATSGVAKSLLQLHGGGGPRGWWIFVEPEVHLRSDVVVPDLAGWRRERLPKMPAEAFFSLRPDCICEVLSPSTGPLDRSRKLPIYAREGVTHAWLIDPATRTLEV